MPAYLAIFLTMGQICEAILICRYRPVVKQVALLTHNSMSRPNEKIREELEPRMHAD
jgi:hypothetical protein